MMKWFGKAKWTFLDQNSLSQIRMLRSAGELDKAEQLLLRGEPSPAVLDELRKIASTRAHLSKKTSDWKAVVVYLERYNEYALEWKDYCIKMVNQEPPEHTAKDQKLLVEAKQWLTGQS